MASVKHKTVSKLITAPPRLYTSQEHQRILQAIVIHKQSCSELAELLGRDRRSVNKRFKILISRGKKQKQPEIQSEPAPQQKQQQPSKNVVLLTCKPHRVIDFTANGNPFSTASLHWYPWLSPRISSSSLRHMPHPASQDNRNQSPCLLGHLLSSNWSIASSRTRRIGTLCKAFEQAFQLPSLQPGSCARSRMSSRDSCALRRLSEIHVNTSRLSSNMQSRRVHVPSNYTCS